VISFVQSIVVASHRGSGVGEPICNVVLVHRTSLPLSAWRKAPGSPRLLEPLRELLSGRGALLEAIAAPNAEVARYVRVWLRGAVDHIERAFDELEAAENAAGGTFQPKD
jgi:hypothetical protein